MMSIYELSWLNVSVAGSAINAGCFLKRNSQLNRRVKLLIALKSLFPAAAESVYAHLDREFYTRSIHDGFLSWHGWVIQERILSPRTVYLGEKKFIGSTANS
jgi:hypothetical protein